MLLVLLFPRSYERGSIEAEEDKHYAGSQKTRFHVHMNVALLKHSITAHPAPDGSLVSTFI